MLSGLRQAAFDWPLLSSVLSVIAPTLFETSPEAACTALAKLKEPGVPLLTSAWNTTILSATYYANTTLNVDTLGTCAPEANISVPLCRVQFAVDTSDKSQIRGEAWLPTQWTGRSLALGNGGLGGCEWTNRISESSLMILTGVDYANLEYGSSLGFATVASNNGHDGMSGESLANSEVLADFTSRAIHVESLVINALTEAYFSRRAKKSYYLGCSTGGRQGMYAAMHYPEDFDGIIAGAPATSFNYLLGWSAMLSKMIGAPDGEASPRHLSKEQWETIHQEIMRQCDSLDGLEDGIISEPDACEFRPEELICRKGKKAHDSCLSKIQVESLKEVYRPLFGSNAQPIFPRFDPGAEAPAGTGQMLSGQLHPYPNVCDFSDKYFLSY